MSGYNSPDDREPRDGGRGDAARGPAGARRPADAPRERMSSDYDDDRAPRRAAGGLDVDVWTRRLVYAAVGIGALLLAAVGGWTLLSGHRGGIVVLGPPPGPVRVKPANPGGMELVDNSGGDTDMTGHGDAHLAPGPEQPDPTALARQYGPPPGAAAPVSTTVPTTAPATGGSTTAPSPTPDKPVVPDAPHPSAPHPAATMPARQTAPSTPSGAAGTTSPEAGSSSRSSGPSDTARDLAMPLPDPVPPPGGEVPGPATPDRSARVPVPTGTDSDTATSRGGGVHMVQLAALETEGQAHEEWARLQHRAPDLLGARSPVIQPVERGGRTLYRLRVSGFDDIGSTKAFCARLRAEQVACTPAAF